MLYRRRLEYMQNWKVCCACCFDHCGRRKGKLWDGSSHYQGLLVQPAINTGNSCYAITSSALWDCTSLRRFDSTAKFSQLILTPHSKVSSSWKYIILWTLSPPKIRYNTWVLRELKAKVLHKKKAWKCSHHYSKSLCVLKLKMKNIEWEDKFDETAPFPLHCRMCRLY